jgi:hypothetical protein
MKIIHLGGMGINISKLIRMIFDDFFLFLH